MKKDLQRRRGPRPQRRRKTVRCRNGLLNWSWCCGFERAHRVEQRRHQRNDRLDGYFRMLLQVAATQFASRDCRPITYVVLECRVRARSRENREKWVVEQKQAKNDTNRSPGKANNGSPRLLGDIAHSIHFIIDASNAVFASSAEQRFVNEPAPVPIPSACVGAGFTPPGVNTTTTPPIFRLMKSKAALLPPPLVQKNKFV
jgi:hypothetical protein